MRENCALVLPVNNILKAVMCQPPWKLDMEIFVEFFELL